MENCKQKIATKWGKKAYNVITSSILKGMLNMQKAKRILSIRTGTIKKFQARDNIFALVDHFNLGRELIIDASEKIELVKLNLSASKIAIDVIAYNAARYYLIIC